jgi:hypothetical protein
VPLRRSAAKGPWPLNSQVPRATLAADCRREVYQIYACRIADGVEQIITLDPKKSFPFPCAVGLPK